MSWLDHSGTIVLGDSANTEHLTVSLQANSAGAKWLDAIPAEHRAVVLTEVSRALSAAALDVKRILTAACNSAWTNRQCIDMPTD